MIPKSQLISLSMVPGMGPRRIRFLLRKYPEVEDMAILSKLDVMQVDGISHDLCTQIKAMNMDTGLRALEKTKEMDAQYLTYWNSGYPELLKVIYDAPVGLFVLGSIPKLPCIGIVGTRHASVYGMTVCIYPGSYQSWILYCERVCQGN